MLAVRRLWKKGTTMLKPERIQSALAVCWTGQPDASNWICRVSVRNNQDTLAQAARQAAMNRHYCDDSTSWPECRDILIGNWWWQIGWWAAAGFKRQHSPEYLGAPNWDRSIRFTLKRSMRTTNKLTKGWYMAKVNGTTYYCRRVHWTAYAVTGRQFNHLINNVDGITFYNFVKQSMGLSLFCTFGGYQSKEYQAKQWHFVGIIRFNIGWSRFAINRSQYSYWYGRQLILMLLVIARPVLGDDGWSSTRMK